LGVDLIARRVKGLIVGYFFVFWWDTKSPVCLGLVTIFCCWLVDCGIRQLDGSWFGGCGVAGFVVFFFISLDILRSWSERITGMGRGPGRWEWG